MPNQVAKPATASTITSAITPTPRRIHRKATERPFFPSSPGSGPSPEPPSPPPPPVGGGGGGGAAGGDVEPVPGPTVAGVDAAAAGAPAPPVVVIFGMCSVGASCDRSGAVPDPPPARPDGPGRGDGLFGGW